MSSHCAMAFALVLLAVTLLASPASADDPRLDYHTIKTPHFWVHYHDGARDFAWKVAITAEEAHELLTPLLGWEPVGRTHVVVNDKVDVANGSATVYGRRTINVFGMPPESDSVLGFYDDWIRVLVFHEYVHVLHLDTILGVPPLVNALIGQQWIPNNTLPRWYTEGLATYYESAHTRGGRVNSSLFQMYLRVASLEGEFFDLGAVTGSPVDWPGGTAAYLYGGFFLDYVVEKHGEQFATQFNYAYGGRAVPWALNSLARDVSGETFDELYDQWRAAEAGSAVAKLVAVSAAGATKVDRITHEGGNTSWPRRRPGTSEIWFYYFDHETAPVYASVLTTGEDYQRRFEVEGGAGAFAFTPDGDELVYSQSVTYESSYRYLDLFAYHIPTKTRRRLTEGERARDPAISPDGRQIAYVRNRGGTMELVVRPYPHVSGPARVLVSGLSHERSDPAHWQQIAAPQWSPDGRKIAFSWWRQSDGHRDLWIVDLDAAPDAALTRVTNDFAVDLDPSWADDGRIYFSSDRTGIYNVYVVDPSTGSVQQVSNVIGGLFTPHLSPDRRWIYVGAYGPEGFDLARFARPETYVDAPPSRLDELVAVTYPQVDATGFDEGPYRPARWLGPLLLKPELGVVTSGAGLGASVESYDPIGHHAWELAAGVTMGREIADRSANLGVSYAYGGLPVSVGVSALARDYSRARSYFVSSDYLPYLERQFLGSLRLSYPFRGLIDTLSATLRYDLDYRKFQDVPQTQLDPMDLEPILPQLGWFNSVGLALSYSNREAYPQSVTTSKGWSVSVGFDVQDPAIGSDYHNLEFNYGFDLYLQNPIWDRHVLALLLDGALTLSELDSPRRFAIGGNRPQDVFTSIVLQQQRREFVVRGFEPNVSTGSHYQVVRVDYRFPILILDEGLSTVPVFLRRLKGSLFLDHGGAYDGFLVDADRLTGLGAELSLETVFAYYLFGNVRLGYARGLGPQGIKELYLLFGGGF